MRSILLYITSAALFAGAFFVPDANALTAAEANKYDGIISFGPLGYTVLTSTGMVVNADTGVSYFNGEGGFTFQTNTFSGTTLNVVYAIKDGIVRNSLDSSIFSGNNYVSVYPSWLGSVCAFRADGTGTCKNGYYSTSTWPTGFPSSITIAEKWQGNSGTNYQEYFVQRKDGSATFRLPLNVSPWTPTLYNFSQVVDGFHHQSFGYILKTDGSINGQFVPFAFTGTYKELSGKFQSIGSETHICAIRQSDSTAECKGQYSTSNSNTPAYALKGITVGSSGRVMAIRVSDNKLIKWSNSTGVEVIGNVVPPIEIPEVVTYSENGMICVKAQVPKLDTVSWINPSFMFSTGSVSTTVFTGVSIFGCKGTIGDRCGDKIRTENADVNYLNVDRLTTWNFDVSTTIRTPSWRDPSIATGPRSTMIPDDYEPQVVGLGSIRNGERYAADVWEFSSVANPSTVEPWAYHTYTDGTLLPIYASGGKATAVLANSQTSFTLVLTEFSVPPIGFRMGKSTQKQTAEYCRVGNNACVWDIVGSAYSCRAASWNNYYGNCAVDAFGRCAPVVLEDGTTSEGTPLEGSNVLRDAAGNVVAVTSADSAIRGSSISVDNVFACEYDGFLDIFPCAVTIVKNVWQLTTDSVNVAMGGGGKVNKAVQSVGSGGTATGSIDLSAVSGSGTNLADAVWRGTWNASFSDDTRFSEIARFALIGSLYMMLLSIVLLIGIVNRKQ